MLPTSSSHYCRVLSAIWAIRTPCKFKFTCLKSKNNWCSWSATRPILRPKSGSISPSNCCNVSTRNSAALLPLKRSKDIPPFFKLRWGKLGRIRFLTIKFNALSIVLSKELFNARTLLAWPSSKNVLLHWQPRFESTPTKPKPFQSWRVSTRCWRLSSVTSRLWVPLKVR